MPNNFKDTALDELSVFYVGVTRARKQVFASASAKRLNSYGVEKTSNFSCLSSIDGVKLVKG
jgi:DNA helicase-2/ATP-dependent DNA helicase PcrA